MSWRLRFGLLVVVLFAGCGGQQPPLDEGRGWWCSSTTSNRGRCFRAWQYCIDETGGDCQRADSAYCFQYIIPVEGESGQNCHPTHSTCKRAMGPDLPSDYRTRSGCEEYR